MKTSPAEIEIHLETLRQTPKVFARLAADFTETQLRLRPSPDEWSLQEILAHLHACAEVWGDDIERMIALDGTRFTKPHPRKVMVLERHTLPPFADAIVTFDALRKHQLTHLQELEIDYWDRGATINGRHHTVYSQVRRMALHEAVHIGQLDATAEIVRAISPP